MTEKNTGESVKNEKKTSSKPKTKSLETSSSISSNKEDVKVVEVNETKVVKEQPKVKASKKRRSKVETKERTYSFEQWASRRAVPKHHRRGLRAFISNVTKKRTLSEWDKLVSSY